MVSGSELDAWLGPALGELNAEQHERFQQAADRIFAAMPYRDQVHDRDLALSGVVQALLGE